MISIVNLQEKPVDRFNKYNLGPVSYQLALEDIINLGQEVFANKMSININKSSKLNLIFSIFSNIKNLKKDEKNLTIFNNILSMTEALYSNNMEDQLVKV